MKGKWTGKTETELTEHLEIASISPTFLPGAAKYARKGK